MEYRIERSVSTQISMLLLSISRLLPPRYTTRVADGLFESGDETAIRDFVARHGDQIWGALDAITAPQVIDTSR